MGVCGSTQANERDDEVRSMSPQRRFSTELAPDGGATDKGTGNKTTTNKNNSEKEQQPKSLEPQTPIIGASPAAGVTTTAAASGASPANGRSNSVSSARNGRVPTASHDATEASSATSASAAAAASSSVTAAAAAAVAAAAAAAAAADDDNGPAPEGPPPVMRRHMSLEDEEDEKTARSLRNFEAEHVLAEQAMHVSTLHREAALAAGIALPSPTPLPGSSPHDSRSPTGSPRHATRSLMYPPVVDTANTPGSNLSPTHGTQFMYPPSSSATSPAHNGSPSHTPRTNGGASTPTNQYSSAAATAAAASSTSPHSYQQQHNPTANLSPTPGSGMTVSAPYVNADILDNAESIFTPTGKRTALALLMTGNNSARTSKNSSPRGPHGMKGSGSPPALGYPSGAMAMSMNMGRGSSMVSFSKTVPNSPRSLSPVNATRSGVITPRVAHIGNGEVSAPITARLLSVPGGSPTNASTTAAAAGAGAGAGPSRSIHARLQPRRYGTVKASDLNPSSSSASTSARTPNTGTTTTNGIAHVPRHYPNAHNQIVYSHSVQTSPRHSRTSTAATVFAQNGEEEDDDGSESDEDSPPPPPPGGCMVEPSTSSVMVMPPSVAATAATPITPTKQQQQQQGGGEELFEQRPTSASKKASLLHRRTGTSSSGGSNGGGADVAVATATSTEPNTGVSATTQSAHPGHGSINYLRFAQMLRQSGTNGIGGGGGSSFPSAQVSGATTPMPHDHEDSTNSSSVAEDSTGGGGGATAHTAPFGDVATPASGSDLPIERKRRNSKP